MEGLEGWDSSQNSLCEICSFMTKLRKKFWTGRVSKVCRVQKPRSNVSRMCRYDGKSSNQSQPPKPKSLQTLHLSKPSTPRLAENLLTHSMMRSSTRNIEFNAVFDETALIALRARIAAHSEFPASVRKVHGRTHSFIVPRRGRNGAEHHPPSPQYPPRRPNDAICCTSKDATPNEERAATHRR